MEKVYIT